MKKYLFLAAALLVLLLGCHRVQQGSSSVRFANSSLGVRSIEVQGYDNAREPVVVTIKSDEIVINSGLPEEEADKAVGWGIKMMFILAAFLLIGGLLCLRFKNARMGANLIGAAIALPIFAIILMQMSKIPTWLWVLAVVVPSIMAAGSVYMKYGYDVRSKQLDN